MPNRKKNIDLCKMLNKEKGKGVVIDKLPPMERSKKRGKKRWENYEDYLKSPEWQKIRKQVHERDKGICQLCGCPKASNPQCHHWTYPSDWNSDSASNVILACGGCHARLHDLEFNFSDADTYPAYLREYGSFLALHDEPDDSIEAAVLRAVVVQLVRSYSLGILENRLHVSGGKYHPEDKYYTIERVDFNIPECIGERLITLLKGSDDVPSQ